MKRMTTALFVINLWSQAHADDQTRLMRNAAWVTGLSVVASGSDVQAISEDRAVIKWLYGVVLVQRIGKCVYEARYKTLEGLMIASRIDFNLMSDRYRRVCDGISGCDIIFEGTGPLWCKAANDQKTCFSEVQFMVRQNFPQFEKTIEYIRGSCPGSKTGPRY